MTSFVNCTLHVDGKQPIVTTWASAPQLQCAQVYVLHRTHKHNTNVHWLHNWMEQQQSVYGSSADCSQQAYSYTSIAGNSQAMALQQLFIPHYCF